jgi:hypothetical protein
MLDRFIKSSEFLKLGWLIAALVSGCGLVESRPTPPPSPLPTVTIQPTATAIPTPAYPWTDENAVLNGICFEAALDAAGQVFVLRRPEDLLNLYDLADNSQLCRHPVPRQPFDFAEGRVLAGLWSAGRGCTAHHEVLSIERDDSARTLTIHLRLITDGACTYELVRPFWIGMDRVSDFTIDLKLIN